MRYGVILTAGDPRSAGELAAEAEAAGWDGVFTWDGISVGPIDTFDPWVTLAVIAMRTTRIRLGAIITPPARRRPWKWAREAISIDHLSDGRLVLPVGLGATDDAGFGNVGEPTDARTRAERLDEALAILEGLAGGEPFGFEGRHHRFAPMTFRPPAIQRPRIPVWPVGAWPHERSLRRALRWDGVYVQAASSPDGVTPEIVREVVAFAARERAATATGAAWDVVVERTSPRDVAAAAEAAGALAEAGATWWIESDWSAGLDALRDRIRAGPPRA